MTARPGLAEVRAGLVRARRRALAAAAALAALAIGLAAIALVGRGPDPAPSPLARDGGAADDRDAGAAPLDAPAPPCDTPAACQARCDASPADADACVRAADQLRTAVGPARDVAGALARHRATCAATRDPAACTRAALMTALLDDHARAPDWFDPAAAPAGQLAAACAAGERGLLACAALELLRVPVADLAGVRARLATCAAGTAAACATALVHDACERERLPEACYLAARAPGSGVDSPATLALGASCQADRDPTVCHYAWLASGKVEHLLLACSDVAEEEDRSVARACLDRVYTSRPRRRELSERACRHGLCEGVRDVRVLAAACAAGQLDACARILAAPAKEATPAQRAAARARAAELAPAVDVDAPPPPPARLRPAYEACRYGAAAACAAVLAKLPTASPLRVPLTGYAARLEKPLTP